MTTFTLKDYYDNMYSEKPTELSEALSNIDLSSVTCSITSPVSIVESAVGSTNLTQSAGANGGCEQKQDEDEYSGGIPIPFLGWAKINEEVDKEEREMMLREQMHIVNEELNEAREIIAKQTEMLDLFQRFIKDQDLHGKWMFFVEDRKSV